MNNKSSIVTNGHAAGKSGQEIGLENELTLLNCIKYEGWIREYEASLITKMSLFMVGQVSRRLANKNQIYRERVAGNAGYFLRLLSAGAERVDGKSGKDIVIPASWPHHAMAIQTLHFLASVLDCEFESEASLRHTLQAEKLPDGRLISKEEKFYFEQERTRKSGANMLKQTEHITNLAAAETICLIAYPYPATICGGIDHETRLTNSIRHKWGSSTAPYIRFVRCHFDNLIDYKNMHVSRFQIINLPDKIKTVSSCKDQPGVTDQVMGFRWTMAEDSHYGQPQIINGILRHCDKICFEGTFIQAASGDDYHLLESDGFISAQELGSEQSFSDFVRSAQKKMEKNAEWEMALRTSSFEIACDQ